MDKKPWIGFAVKNGASGRSVLVKDVVEGGPADKSGLRDLDEITKMGGKAVPNMDSFRKIIKELSVGDEVAIEILRGQSHLVQMLIVGQRGIQQIPKPPVMNTLSDLQQVLNDPTLLKQAADSGFAMADEDGSGLVSKKEFVSIMRQWFSSFIGNTDDKTIENIFEQSDIDKSGFLARSEFTNVVSSFLSFTIKMAKGKESPSPSYSRSGSVVGARRPSVAQRRASLAPGPWLGFAVRNSKTRSGVVIVDVAEGGPAAKAGLKENDEIITISALPIPNLTFFREIIKPLQPGQNIEILVHRPTQGRVLEKSTVLCVGVRKPLFVDNPPSMSTLHDLEVILADPEKTDRAALLAFVNCDQDCSGLVSKKEFKESMRKWLGPLSEHHTDEDLESVFEAIDVDDSGFLTQSEFPALIVSLFHLLASHNKRNVGGAVGGKPWLGLIVKQPRGKSYLIVHDVAERSPATVAGVKRTDQILTVSDIPTNTVAQFKQRVQELNPFDEVEMEVLTLDGIRRRVRTVVGHREPPQLEAMPKMKTEKDVREILKDPTKLSIVSSAAFASADSDCSGLVSRSEFLVAARRWLGPEISNKLSDDDLLISFDKVDVDHTTYLNESEFLQLTTTILEQTLNKTGNETHGDINAGKPWLGFDVRRVEGRQALVVSDIVNKGPAQMAGIRNTDELATINRVKVPTMALYKQQFRTLIPGQVIDVEILRRTPGVGRQRSSHKVTVGKAPHDPPLRVPLLDTPNDIENVLQDNDQLETLATCAFRYADTDRSGLISLREFQQSVRQWLPPNYAHTMSDAELAQLFRRLDIDNSGHLQRPEFVPLVQGVLERLVVGMRKRPTVKSGPSTNISESYPPSLATQTQPANTPRMPIPAPPPPQPKTKTEPLQGQFWIQLGEPLDDDPNDPIFIGYHPTGEPVAVSSRCRILHPFDLNLVLYEVAWKETLFDLNYTLKKNRDTLMVFIPRYFSRRVDVFDKYEDNVMFKFKHGTKGWQITTKKPKKVIAWFTRKPSPWNASQLCFTWCPEFEKYGNGDFVQLFAIAITLYRLRKEKL